jgi:hypothetical protein
VQFILKPLQDLFVLLVVDVRDALDGRLVSRVVVVNKSVAIDRCLVILGVGFAMRSSKKRKEPEGIHAGATHAESTPAKAGHTEAAERTSEAPNATTTDGAACRTAMSATSSATSACHHDFLHVFDLALTISVPSTDAKKTLSGCTIHVRQKMKSAEHDCSALLVLRTMPPPKIGGEFRRSAGPFYATS